MGVKRTYKSRTTDPHDWDRTPEVEGVVMDKDILIVDDEERAFLNIDTGESISQVFHTHALTDAFNCAEVGDHIHIQYRGKIKTKKKGHTFSRFAVQVWTEGEDDESSEEETPF